MRAQRSHFPSDKVLSSIPGAWSLQKSRAWRFMFLNIPFEILSLYILPHQRTGLSFRVLALFSRKARNCFRDLTLQTPPSPFPAQPTTHPGPGPWTKSSESSATLNQTAPTTITALKPKAGRVHLPKTGLDSNNWSLGGSGDNHLRESEAESEICINVKLVFAVKCSTIEVYHHEAGVWTWKKPDC